MEFNISEMLCVIKTARFFSPTLSGLQNQREHRASRETEGRAATQNEGRVIRPQVTP